MEEILRFQHLRQVQKVSDEEKRHLGLALYYNNQLSELATKLENAGAGKNSYSSIMEEYKNKNHGRDIITGLNQINPSIASIYKWLDFKAKPIKFADFKQFVQSIDPANQPDLAPEWTLYADNLLFAIYNNSFGSKNVIDFQLLIRACYIYRLCITFTNAGAQVMGNERMLNDLVTAAILLPDGTIRSRCDANPDNQNKTVADAITPDTPAPTHGHDAIVPIASVSAARIATPVYNDPCKCTCDETTCHTPSKHCICAKTYVADLFIVKEELARYEEGDIADIENILAGEVKERKLRNLFRTESSTETENETTTSEQRDHQVNEKFSLQSTIKNTIDSKVNVDAGISSTLKYGESVTLTPHANVISDTSKSNSEDIARSYAKDVTDRAVTQIQEKVRKLQISRIINEFEEKNKHSISNVDSEAKHRAGIYYWVNKVSHAQVFNYGKHMMFDVIVPEPAAIFKNLYELKTEKKNDKVKPVKPELIPEMINRDNYGSILHQYNISDVDGCEPPDDFKWIQFAFDKSLTEPEDEVTQEITSSEFKSPPIPQGYKAVNLHYDVRVYVGDRSLNVGHGMEAALSVSVGNNHLISEGTKLNSDGVNNWSKASIITMNGETDFISLSVAGFSTVALSVSGTVSIQCQLTKEAFEKWKLKIYSLAMADYNRKLESYNQQDNKDAPSVQIKGRNPFLNREIERNEFKRHIIAILMCNYFNGIGSMMEKVAPCGYPEIDFEKLEKDAPLIQFFEQVFEWNYINYLFYHSMWARKCKWPELIDEDSGDPLFDKFLMAGASRVQVPIRPGMEEMFGWFLKTGQIWGASGIPPIPGDDEYVSMIQELKESKQCDYKDRPGSIEAVNGSTVLRLTYSGADKLFYWDNILNQVNELNIKNDIDRELLVNYKIYRIIKVEQIGPSDNTVWNISIERPFEDATMSNVKHAVGSLFVGAPWEIVIPSKLVYLRNETDKLPMYPLN